jgi:hypothetical protein
VSWTRKIRACGGRRGSPLDAVSEHVASEPALSRLVRGSSRGNGLAYSSWVRHGLLVPLVRRQGAFNDRAWHAHKPHAGGQGAGRRPYARLVARGTLNCTTQQRRRLPFLNNMSCFVRFSVTVFSALETASQGNGGQPLASRNSG